MPAARCTLHHWRLHNTAPAAAERAPRPHAVHIKHARAPVQKILGRVRQSSGVRGEAVETGLAWERFREPSTQSLSPPPPFLLSSSARTAAPIKAHMVATELSRPLSSRRTAARRATQGDPPDTSGTRSRVGMAVHHTAHITHAPSIHAASHGQRTSTPLRLTSHA